MHYVELILIALGLSMDAFAVSVSNGMTMRNLRLKDALKFGLFFGLFQMLMPIIGWAAGQLFREYLATVDHWATFVLLGYIGVKMIAEAGKCEETCCTCISFRLLLTLAVATSIDALAAGITFTFMELDIISSAMIIGLITFLLSTFGALIGKRAGDALGSRAQIAGGGLLILMGAKVLVEHLFF